MVFVTPNFENNSLGRTYCLWLLARQLGWPTTIVGVKGAHVWAPLQGSRFARDCVLPPPRGAMRAVAEAIGAADLVVAVKPLPSSFGVALGCAGSTPLLLDVDDPDIEVRTTWAPIGERLRSAVRQPNRHRELLRLRRAARDLPVTVSNPELQRMYGGVIVPHVRAVPELPDYTESRAPVVRFVGSPRGHKGVELLRAAVARLEGEGFRLEVTASPPQDPRPWETWFGMTTMDEGERLVRTADIVAIPSLARSWARAQLPAKLIDAMMHGRAVVASETAPMRWALGGAGELVPPGDVDALVAALRAYVDPDRRRRAGLLARARAEQVFSVDTVADSFYRAASEAMGLTVARGMLP